MVWNAQRKKPASIFAPTPVNTLNGPRQQTTSSRPIPPTPSRKSESISPSPKRQKVRESPANFHTEAHFALQPQFDGLPDSVIPRKRSASDSISASETHHTMSGQSSSNKSNSQNISELRQVEKYVRTPTGKRPRRKTPKREGREESTAVYVESDEDRDPLAEDGDVRVVEYPEGTTFSQQQPKSNPHHGDLPLDALKKRFQSTPRGPPGTKNLYSIIESATKKRPRSDHSDDELSADAYAENPRTRIPVPHAQPKSLSLSTKGDVKRTQFTVTKFKPRQLQKTPVRPESDAKVAAGIIGSGLEVKRAVDGQFGFGESTEPNGCRLSARELSTILHPTDRQNGSILGKYSYLTINLLKAHDILVPSTPEGRIICVKRSSDITVSAGAKLYVEFSYPPDVEKFTQWVTMPRQGLNPISVSKKPEMELERELNRCFKNADRPTVIRDGQLAEDVMLMQHNAQARLQDQSHGITMSGIRRAQTLRVPRKLLRDTMESTVPSTATNDTYEIPESPPQSREARPVRTTRSTFVPKDPTPEPELPSWTASNPDWELRWRNSLIFPSHGKSRATVDKHDIERLNEGQFLNDNIIIFYLRYLQHKLETELPDQAQRIYFQNTFFFDKLKPTKASGRINYDSVKGWTSKVDLFAKDYIVVPINEYSHWYVAIIYNVPKLIPSEPESPDTPQPQQESIVVEDGNRTPQIESTVEDSDQAGTLSSAQNDVEAGISRMSIHSPGIIEKEAKQAEDADRHTPQEVVEGSKDTAINLTQEPEAVLPEVEQTQSLGGMGRKKAGKKQSSGPRRYDPDQPRIITLDSLGGSHSPACNFLKQYLVAELKDKKDIEIPSPGALGMTAKNIPLQLNYCDCGLYLLGYIQEFLKDPDTFVRSILQHERIQWDLDPSDLRNRIRDVIFELQGEQQEREDAHKEEKRRAASKKPRNSSSRPSSRDEPKGKESPAKLRREAETNTAPEIAERSDHDAKSEVQSAAPKQTANTSLFFRRDENKTKANLTKEHTTSPLSNTEESNIAIQPKTSSIPELERQQLLPSRDSSSERIPGSFPTSPPKTQTRITIEIPSQETVQSSNADNISAAEKKLLSPLMSSPRTSSHRPTTDADRNRRLKVDDLNRDYTVTDPATKTPKKLANGTHPESPRRHRKTHSRSHIDSSPQRATTSHHFAGRRDGDTQGHAKCTLKPVQNNEVVELSD